MDELTRISALYPDDLEANQNGELSERQKLQLKLIILGWSSLAVLEVILLAVFIYLQVTYLNEEILWGVVIVGGLLFLAYTGIMNARPYWKDLEANVVKRVAAGIHKEYLFRRHSRNKQLTYKLSIGNQTFVISPTIYEALKQGGYYRVYYLPASRKIVNIDPFE